MNPVVVDASVVAKWLFVEQDTDKARALWADFEDSRLELVAPEILTAEIASVISLRVQRGLLQPGQAMSLYDRYQDASLLLEGISTLSKAALTLSLRYRHSVYDCLYVALAVKLACHLITADQRLFNALGADMPQIQLLNHWNR